LLIKVAQRLRSATLGAYCILSDHSARLGAKGAVFKLISEFRV